MADDPVETPAPEATEPETTAVPIEPETTEAGITGDVGVTSVNSQITDAVTQSDDTVLGDAPGLALALVYQSLAQATSLAFLNATQQQQQGNMIAQAATAAAVARILGGDVPPVKTP